MLRTDEGEWFSASDVLAWLGCTHRTALDTRALDDDDLRVWLSEHRPTAMLINPDVEELARFDSPAQIRGDAHERAMLQRLEAEGRQITRIDRPESLSSEHIRARADETLEAMRAGAEVIFQAALLDAPWYGFADFLVRVDGVASNFGDYAYEIRDTKLARHATVNALLQMAHYGAIVETWQGAPPPNLQVWIGTGELVTWPYSDAVPYLREAQGRYLTWMSNQPTTTPEPCQACALCRWADYCDEAWGPDDLIRVHRLTRQQRALLRTNGMTTIAELATSTSRPQGMASATFERLRQQAKAQVGDAQFEIIRPQSRQTGLASVPAPDAGDLYFDLEGDPFAGSPTLDYLWAFCDASGTYSHQWAHDADAELQAFAWFISELENKDAAGGDWHLYHYNAYEVTSLRRLADRWPHPDDRMPDRVEHLVATRFVDLYRVVERSLRTHKGTTSLKLVERLAGYDRTASSAAVARADESIVEYERFILSRNEDERSSILQGILDYNTHDVRATLAVHHWLYGCAQQLSDEDLIEEVVDQYTPSANVVQRGDRTEELRQRLLAAGEHGPLPSGLTAAGARLLAGMLDWHKRESAVAYIDALRLQAWAREEADPDADSVDDGSSSIPDLGLDAPAPRDTHIQRGTEHESCLLDPQIVSIGPPSPRKRRHEFTCRPGSWKVRTGSTVVEVLPLDSTDKARTFTIADCDPAAGTFAIDAVQCSGNAIAYALQESYKDDAIWESLMRLGEASLISNLDGSAKLGLAMLDAVPPVPAHDMAPIATEDASARARRIAGSMQAGILPVQGPPGTGKTWLGSRLIADAIRRKPDAVILVTAQSHRVIDNLMRAAAAHLIDEGLQASMARAADDAKFEGSYGAEQIKNPDVAVWVQRHAGEARIVGATKFAFARLDTQGLGDLLVIDEAAQFSLADALAVAQVAPMAYALGDPQQLSSPIRAAHADEVSVSLLAHLARGNDVIADEHGVFLNISHRMHPALCAVVGDLAYRGALHSSATATSRNIHGNDVTATGNTIPVAPGVHWLPIPGGQEVEIAATQTLIEQLLGHASVTQADGNRAPLKPDELLAVAPHNATVNRLHAVLPGIIRVGTVDRFQGQEGEVVIFAMGRIAEEAGDVPFLYEINRLNVALSRARLLAIVVASPDALFPPVANPEHLLLASRFIRALAARP